MNLSYRSIHLGCLWPCHRPDAQRKCSSYGSFHRERFDRIRVKVREKGKLAYEKCRRSKEKKHRNLSISMLFLVREAGLEAGLCQPLFLGLPWSFGYSSPLWSTSRRRGFQKPTLQVLPPQPD